MELNNIYLVIKIILGLLTIVGIILAGFWRWCPRIWVLFRGKKTITLVNDDTGHVNFWHIGSQSGKPILQISCKFMGTNNADHPVALARAIWKGALRGSVEYSQVSVKDLGSQYWGGYDIPPKKRTGVSVDFMILPKILPTPGAEIRLDVGVIDQFGNTHWVKDVILRSA